MFPGNDITLLWKNNDVRTIGSRTFEFEAVIQVRCQCIMVCFHRYC